MEGNIMNLYNFDENKRIVGEGLGSFNEVVSGGKYIMADHDFQVHIRSDKEVLTLTERSNEGGIVFITNHKGEQPFAPFTNDCTRDGMEENVLAKVTLRVGYKIHIILHTGENVLPYYIFNVDEIDLFNERAYVTCMKVTDTLNAPSSPALTHVVKAVKQKDVITQLKDKFCFQTARSVFTCLMRKNRNGKLSTVKNKRSFELNTNSDARRDSEGNDYEEGFYRAFYSKRMKDSALIYVEAVRIPDEYFNIDINDYVSTLDYSNVLDSIREIETMGGMKVYGIINNRGDVRVIMNSGFYSTFILSEYEVKYYIKSIEPVKNLLVNNK